MKLLDGIISWNESLRRSNPTAQHPSRVEVDVTDDGEVMLRLDVHDIRCTLYLKPDDAFDLAEQLVSAARSTRDGGTAA